MVTAVDRISIVTRAGRKHNSQSSQSPVDRALAGRTPHVRASNRYGTSCLHTELGKHVTLHIQRTSSVLLGLLHLQDLQSWWEDLQSWWEEEWPT